MSRVKDTLYVGLPDDSDSWGNYNDTRAVICLENFKDRERPTSLVIYPHQLISLTRICESMLKNWQANGVLL